MGGVTLRFPELWTCLPVFVGHWNRTPIPYLERQLNASRKLPLKVRVLWGDADVVNLLDAKFIRTDERYLDILTAEGRRVSSVTKALRRHFDHCEVLSFEVENRPIFPSYLRFVALPHHCQLILRHHVIEYIDGDWMDVPKPAVNTMWRLPLVVVPRLDSLYVDGPNIARMYQSPFDWLVDCRTRNINTKGP